MFLYRLTRSGGYIRDVVLDCGVFRVVRDIIYDIPYCLRCLVTSILGSFGPILGGCLNLGQRLDHGL
jgi:hypothetical protein